MKPQYKAADVQHMRVACYFLAAKWLNQPDGNGTVAPHSFYETTKLAEEYLRSYIQAGVSADDLQKYVDRIQEAQSKLDELKRN